MADDGVHDPNLYQFLDFTRVEQSQKNEHRPFRWLSRFRRKSQVAAKSNYEATTKEQHGSQVPINYVVDDVSPHYRPQPAYQQAPQRHRESSKKPKDNSYIILPPPPPSASQAKQINIPPHDIYLKQEKKSKIPLVAAYRQRQKANKPIQPLPLQPTFVASPEYIQQAGEVDSEKTLSKLQVNPEVPYSSQQTVDYASHPNAPLVLNEESDSGEDSPPTHVGSRYSKWFGKLRRNKGDQDQPEKLQNQPLKLHDKPSEDLAVQAQPLYYFQNSSPNNPSQPIPHQPVNGQVEASGYRQPQTVNTPPRPVNTRPQTGEPTYSSHSPASFYPETPISPTVSHDSQEHSPDSSETVDHSSPPNRKKFYSKFMTKIKRTKNKKQEETLSQEEPIFTPLQTAYKPPIEPAVYRPPQTANYPPQPLPSRPPNVKPQPVGPAPYSSSGAVRPVFNPPAPAHHDAPAPTTYSPPQSQYDKFSTRPPYPTTEKPVAYSPPQGDTFFSPPKEPAFMPSPFHGQSEKVHGSHENSEDGFFEFGIFPKNNGFFEQNFNG